uniref:3-beta hydroxysteroid dehydrogenase/isomerase domain-containing protein n=1 Tax=Biomphalaria glabrata TaxID=6526 RepID=A0A2C9K911_BIOGL
MTGTGDKEVHVVTGGAGFPGFSLGKQLTKKGHLVRLFDIKEPVWELEDGMEFIKGDIVEGRKLCEVIKGANAVYHLASYGMSGREQLSFFCVWGKCGKGDYHCFVGLPALNPLVYQLLSPNFVLSLNCHVPSKEYIFKTMKVFFVLKYP